MYYQTEKEIEDLIHDFIERKLPKEKWTHQAHLTGAIWHLVNHDFYEAVCLIKSRIIAYNLSVGGENNSASGYHETLTIFWMKVVGFYVGKNKDQYLLNITNQFLQSNLASRSVTEHFYDKEKLMSAEARSIYIEPEKMELTNEVLDKILKAEIIPIS